MDKVLFRDIEAEHINRYRLIPVAGSDSVYDIAPERGVVTQEGTPVRAKELNDMQDNIDNCKADKTDMNDLFAAKVNNDDETRLIHLYTMTPVPDDRDPGDWRATPPILPYDKNPVNGETIRAVWTSEWTTGTLYSFLREVPILPAGTYPAGTYLLSLDYGSGDMAWHIQGAEPIGLTAERLEEKVDRRDAAAPVTGTVSGELEELKDAVGGSRLQSVTVSGKTTETGTGEKGPDNPYTLTGVRPGKLWSTGTNLYDNAADNIYDKCTRQGTGVKVNIPTGSYFAEISTRIQVFNGQTYTLSHGGDIDPATRCAIVIRGTRSDGKSFQESDGKAGVNHCTITVSGFTKITSVQIRFSRKSTAATEARTAVIKDIMFTAGGEPRAYTTYVGAFYPLPVTVPLRSLPDGTADSYCADTGEQVIRVGSMTLIPDMMWEAKVRANTTRFVSSVRSDVTQDGAYNAVRCNYLPTAEVYDTDAVGICLREGRVVLSLPGSWDTSSLYYWLAVPEKGAVTMDYPLAEPAVTQLAGIGGIPAPGPDACLSAEGAVVTATYIRDTNAALDKKADKASVTTSLEEKADKASVTTALDEKIDRQDAAPVLIGAAAGELVHPTDAQEGSRLRSAVIGGRTIETGTGEKGPDNPFTLSGVQPAEMAVSGKNLFNFNGPYIEDGCRAEVSGNVLTLTRTLPGAHSYGAGFSLYLTAGTYYIRANSTSSDGGAAGMTVLMGNTFIWHQAYTQNPRGSFTVPVSGRVRVYFYVPLNSAVGDTATFTEIQLEPGSAATDYEPYRGGTCPLPLTAPLFSLADGTRDTYDMATGELTTRMLFREITGTEVIYTVPSWETETCVRMAVTMPGNLVPNQMPICSHFPEKGTERIFVGANVLPYFFVLKSRLGIAADDDEDAKASKFKSWVAAEKAAGRPVTIAFQKAKPTVTRLAAAGMPALPAREACLSAQGAWVTAEYNRDTNAVIADLTARIQALESGAAAV